MLLKKSLEPGWNIMLMDGHSKKLNSNYTLIDNINFFTSNYTDNIVLFYDFAKEKYGFLDSNGNVVLKPICEKIESNPDN